MILYKSNQLSLNSAKTIAVYKCYISITNTYGIYFCLGPLKMGLEYYNRIL